MSLHPALRSPSEHSTAKDRPSPTPGLPASEHDSPAEAGQGTPFFLQAALANVQRKVLVGAPNDPLEREADTIAEQVSAQPAAPAATMLEEQPPVVQRTPTPTPSLPSSLPSGAGGASLPGLATQIARPSGGSPLASTVRAPLEATLGKDLGHVRVHDDASANRLSSTLGAKAFTHGSHIWLGRGQSRLDLRLLAHEAAHVAQQDGLDDAPPVQRSPADYQHPEDGTQVAARLRGEIQAEVGDLPESDPAEARRRIGTVDRGQVSRRREGLTDSARPDVDRVATERPGIDRAAAETDREADSPAQPLAEGDQSGSAESGGGGERQPQSAAQSASAAAEAAFALADSVPEAAGEPEVIPPPPVEPLDAGGRPLPADPGADQVIGGLATEAQTLRDGGLSLRAAARVERQNAQLLAGNVTLVRGHVATAAAGVATSTEHLAFRRQVLGQARSALGVSEQKAETVAADAPGFQSRAEEGRAESQPMASEATAMASENAAQAPDDAEAAERSREQGEGIGRVERDSASMDEAISQTAGRAVSLQQDAERARELNSGTRERLDGIDETLGQTRDRIGELGQRTQTASAEVDSLASQPDELRARADALDLEGLDILQRSYELERSLGDAQRNHEAGLRGVPAPQPLTDENADAAFAGAANLPAQAPSESGEGAPEPSSAESPEASADAQAMSSPETAAPRGSGPAAPEASAAGAAPESEAAGGEEPAAPGPALASVAQASMPPPVLPSASPGPAEVASTTAASGGGASLAPVVRSNFLEADTASRPAVGTPAAVEPDVAIQRQPEDLAAGEDLDAGADAGPAVEAAPPLPEDAYERRERIDLVSGVPSWLSGVPAPNEAQRAEQEAAERRRRQEEIDFIRSRARDGVEKLGGGERLWLAAQLMGRSAFRSMAGIQWPSGFAGWAGATGRLALGLLDPRTALTGVLSGLGMMLSGGANLFSMEQWRRDPIGNALKSAADIATGLTIVLGSITALAGVIAAIMAAITILSLGFAAPVTGPIIAFCTTVMVTVGGWTIAVGKVALVLQALVLIKNLIEAACARTAEDLQGQTDQIRSDAGAAGQVLLQMGMARLGQVGGRHAQARIAQAGGGVRAAATLGARGLPARAVRGVRFARADIRAAGGLRGYGRGLLRRGRAGAARRGASVREAAAQAGGYGRLGAQRVGDFFRGGRDVARSLWRELRTGGPRAVSGREGLSRNFLVGEGITNFGGAAQAASMARRVVTIRHGLSWAGRPDLHTVLDDIAALESQGRVVGYRDWLKGAATEPPSGMVRHTSELLEARRVAQAAAGQPGMIVRIGQDAATTGKSFDMTLERELPGSPPQVLRRIEVATEQAAIVRSRDLHSGITHGAQKIGPLPPPGTPIAEAGAREATVVVNWPPAATSLGGDATQVIAADGTISLLRPGVPPRVRGNIFDLLKNDLNGWRGNAAVNYLDRVNIVDNQGNLVATLQNTGNPSTGVRNWVR